MIDGFNRLRHDAVIRRDNEHDDVRHIGPPRAHRGKGGVTGCIDERKCRPIMIHGVGADVLGNSARFTCRDTRLADRIHQRCFAMINVSHERDDGTARFEFLFLFDNRRRRRDNYLFYLVNAGSFFTAFFFENEPVILRDFRRDVGFDCLIDVGEDIVSHQLGDELMRF